MTKLHRSDEDLDQRAPQGPMGTPGKVPVTARLARSTTNIIFRVESADAARELAGNFGPRDANGVAASADAAVDRAGSSSGSALPAALQSRFESSLGTDLSSVRIHTGSESAEAASAVGAKAYTTGQDIHFGAGHYDPSSAFGVHLIAHEVAHTVQQQGAAPTRQHKLEVSTPQDALEDEADRAADGMVTGSPVSLVGIAGSSVARKKVETRNELEIAGDEGMKDPSKAGGLAESTAGSSITVEGKGEAETFVKDVESWKAGLMQKGFVDEAGKNEGLIAALQDYGAASETVTFAAAGFKGAFAGTKKEYARLVGMAESAAFMGFGFGKPGEKSGAETAGDQIDIANGGKSNSAEALNERANQIIATSGKNGGVNKDLQGEMEKVKISASESTTAAGQVADGETKVTNSMGKFSAAKSTLEGTIAGAEAAKLREEFEKAKAVYEEQKKEIEGLFDTLGELASGAIEGPTGVAKKAGEIVIKGVFKAIGEMVVPKLDTTKGDQAKLADEKAAVLKYNGAVKGFNAAGGDVAAQVTALAKAATTLKDKKRTHALNLKTLGQHMDKADPKQKGSKGTGTFEAISTFQGQADAFLVAADATKQIGERDLKNTGTGAGAGDAVGGQSAAKTASDAAKKAGAMVGYEWGMAMGWVPDNDPSPSIFDKPQGTWHPPEGNSHGYWEKPAAPDPSQFSPGCGGKRMKRGLVPAIVKHTFSFQGQKGPDDEFKLNAEVSVDAALKELAEYVSQIREYRNKLAGAMGFT